MAEIPINRQIRCVEREIAIRREVYRWRVSQGKMDARVATDEIETMEAVLATLRSLHPAQRPLFTGN